MKIAFDEHVPVGLVRVFETLAAERGMRRTVGATGRGSTGGLEVVSARTYAPDRLDSDFVAGSDVPWLERFATDGGTAIISGDSRMLEVPHEVLAIQRLGLIVICFERRWNNWNFLRKSALLLWHWAIIVEAIKTGKPGDVYRVPAAYTDPGSVHRISSAGQQELLQDAMHAASVRRKARRKARATKPAAPTSKGQGRLPM